MSTSKGSEKQDPRGRPKRAQPQYQFTEKLPPGVTPEEARERVVAALGHLVAQGLGR